MNMTFLAVCVALQFKPEEIAGIMRDFDEPGSLAPTGLYLGGTKYMVIQGEPGAVIRGKKVSLSLRHRMGCLSFSCYKIKNVVSCFVSDFNLLPCFQVAIGISLEWIL